MQRLTRRKPTLYVSPVAQVAELVDALVSGTSGASREGSSPFLGTTLRLQLRVAQPHSGWSNTKRARRSSKSEDGLTSMIKNSRLVKV